jgi:Spy/CpxP family protein refolding chaperone
MNKFQGFVLASAILGLSATAIPTSALASADAEGSGKRPFAQRQRMQKMMLGGHAPLISLALKHKSELNLDSNQVTTLEQIRANYEKQAKPVAQELRGIETEIANLLQETPANLIQVRQKIEQAEKLRSELRYLRVEALENGKGVLTAEQRDQLKNLVASAHERFRKRHQGQQPS